MLSLAACKDSDGEVDEFDDWQNRNVAYFMDVRGRALDSIRQAKNMYGEDWEGQCNWKTYLSYSLDETVPNRAIDSIYVQVLRKGTGDVSPFATDSCRIFYRGRLIPTANYPEGMVYSHPGQSSKFEDVFDRRTAVPTLRKAASFERGVCTALIRMRVGDRWRVYIPYPLGYGVSTEHENIPAYSTLVYEVELVAFYRNGSNVPSWN